MKRRLLPQKGILACLLAFMLLAPMAEAQAQVFVRRDFATLTTAQINALRNGIAAMQRRPVNDRTSWLYQANIHGTPPNTPLQPAWNTCEHGTYFFLSWHRMYLYYFERILRRASGDPNFALPYWNWSTQRALPPPFRLPANASNPLYVSTRAPAINNGGQLREIVVSFSTAFQRTNFSSPAGNGISFGGQRAGPDHGGSPQGQFESRPHGTVHTGVGGWMGGVNLAARDPIFWLHHANIDRLWKRWLDLGGGRSNPPASDTLWMNTPFTFFDENGQSVTRTGAQILDTVTQLNYRYDDDPAATAAAAALPAREMLGTSIETQVDLDPTRYVRFSVPIKEEVRPRITRFTAGEEVAGTLVLNIEGIEYDEDPGVYYEVYINLPKGEKAPDPRSPHFVGTLATFALPQGGKHMLAITEAARDLKDTGRWNDKNISVTFVPRGPLPPPGKPEAAQVAPTTKVKIGRISVSME